MNLRCAARTVAVCALTLGVMGLGAARGAELATSEANRMVEVTFTAANEHKDPFSDVELDAVFTTPRGDKVRVPAFWAGGKTWRLRYSSSAVGRHHYCTTCSDTRDRGLHGREGIIEIHPYKGDNALYRHGPIRVAGDHRHFEHADGTPFLWLGDTWWMGLCQRLAWPDDFKSLTKDRRDKGFNVVQIVAGLYPDMPAFDERGRNEAGFPWTAGYGCIRPEYFDRADERLGYLADQGVVPCIVVAWGYHLPWMGVDRMKRHTRYLVARYGALPVVWCVGGEINLPYYLEKGFPQGGEKQAAGWEEVIRYARTINGFNRLITAHPTGLPPLSARGLYKDQGLLDFDMLQTGHGQQEVLAPSIRALRASYEARPAIPVLNGEVCYEALLDRIPAAVCRLMFWTSMLSGAAGHTYGANGIWQVNRKGQPYGKSPHGGTYGSLPWDEAMKLPGSGQLALARRLLEQLPWHRFEPHPEWASWQTTDRATNWGDWIWFPEGDPARDAPVEARFFRKVFELPAGKRVDRAWLRLTVDDRFTAYLNGQLLGSHADWKTGREFPDVGRLLRPGKNVLAVLGENLPGPPGANPAGLACKLQVVLSDNPKIIICSDGTWSCSRKEADGWQRPDFDERGWEKARVVARQGEGPWRTDVNGQDKFMVPYAAGVPGRVRVFYLPRALAVNVQGLERDKKYVATTFDPVSGRRENVGPVRPDAEGSWRIAPPRSVESDWVLILETPGAKP
jgi:Protein of unknown function (DUF4038)/Domain of unknown function (DUF5060)